MKNSQHWFLLLKLKLPGHLQGNSVILAIKIKSTSNLTFGLILLAPLRTNTEESILSRTRTFSRYFSHNNNISLFEDLSGLCNILKRFVGQKADSAPVAVCACVAPPPPRPASDDTDATIANISRVFCWYCSEPCGVTIERVLADSAKSVVIVSCRIYTADRGIR